MNTTNASSRQNVAARQAAAWKHDVVNKLSVLFAILGVPLWLIIFADWEPDFLGHFFIYLLIISTAFVRLERYVVARATILCAGMLVIGALAMFSAGLEGNGRMIMGSACVLTALLLGLRTGLAFALIALAALSAEGYQQVMFEAGDAVLWIRTLAVTAILLFAVILAMHLIVSRYNDMVNRLAEQEETVRQDLEQLQFITENSTDTIWTLDLDGGLTYISPNVEALRGYSAAETIELGYESFLPGFGGNVKQLIQSRLDNDTGVDPDAPITTRMQLARKDGELVDVEVTSRFLRDTGGQPIGVIGASRNISDRVRLEKAMNSVLEGTRRRKGADFLSSMVQSLGNAMGVKGVFVGYLVGDLVQTVATWMDGQLAENFSYRLEGSPCATVLVHDVAMCTYGADVQQRFPDDAMLAAMDIQAYVGTPLFADEGEVIGIMVCIHDRRIDDTEFAQNLLQMFAGYAASELVRRRVEEESRHTRTQLIQAQKLDSIGQLAGGIAHDFNNLLVVIQGYLDLARPRIEGQLELLEYNEQIQAATERAAKLTRQLLSFSRRQVLTKEPVHLNELLNDIQHLMSRLLPVNVRVEFTPNRDIRMVEVDRNQVEQAIVNLCVNARDAMPEGGTITFTLDNITAGEEAQARHPGIETGDYVRLRVSDTGKGMDEWIVERIFEPFFTTKPEGLGTGLGLSVLLGVVEQHGGFVDVESEPGRGSTFTINLPARMSGVESKPAIQKTEPQTGTELILIVEDEPMVMTLGKKMLESGGYRVLAAPDGAAALQLVREHGDDIALAVVDVVLPEISGKELADEILKLQPTLPLLFVSGYAPGGIHTNFVLEEGLTLLQKPYSRSELLNQVRRLLDEEQDRQLDTG